MAADQVNIPDGIGRNDPCPCGSGKKYKKCHYKVHRIEKEKQKSTVSVEGLVESKTTPWEMFKILKMVNTNNVANLFWELSHEMSPFREKYPSLESYVLEVATGVKRLPAGPDYELLRIRHDGPDIKLLIATGHDDPKMQSVRAEIVTMRPNQIDANRKLRSATHYGYRVWDVDYATCSKADYEEEPTFENFGVEWEAAWDAPENWYPPIPEFGVARTKTSPPVRQLATFGELETAQDGSVSASAPAPAAPVAATAAQEEE